MYKRQAKVLRRAVKKKNFGWRDKTGRLRKSVRLAKVRGFFVQAGGRRVRVKAHATVVLGDYRKLSKTYAPYAHLVARGYVLSGRVKGYKRKSTGTRVKGYTRRGGLVKGKRPLERAFIANFPAIQAEITGNFSADFEREMRKEIQRAYRGQLRKLLRGDRSL